MAARSKATQFLATAVSRSTNAARPRHVRPLIHATWPSKQASLVDARPSQSSELPSVGASNDQPFASAIALRDQASKGEPLQVLTQSGITVAVYPSTVSIRAPEHGLTEEFHFSHVWLRDACTEESSVDQSTKQKLFHTSDIHIPAPGSKTGLLDSATMAELTKTSGRLPILRLAYSAKYPVINAFSAAFSSAPPASAEPHISNIPLSTLLEHALPDLYASSHGDIGGESQPWTASDLSAFPPGTMPVSSQQVEPKAGFDRMEASARPSRLQWSALLGEQESSLDAKFALVNGLMRDGIAFVTELPTDKTGKSIEASQEDSPNLARLAEMLGEIRHTFYGSLWDVRSLGAASRNIAFTNLDLGLHMDLCYFQNPPRFQLLHMLRNKVKGGQSIFVDAFKVAEEMWIHHRPLWKALTEVPVGFHYQNDGRHYRYTHPTFQLTSTTSGHSAADIDPLGDDKMPRLTAVNYSPPFQSPLPLHPAPSAEKEADFYAALQLFSELTLDKRFRYERTLVEGEAVVFDNRRVLHSRRGFEWSEEQEKDSSNVKRWLKGCYIDGDAVWSTYRVLLARSQGGKLGLSS